MLLAVKKGGGADGTKVGGFQPAGIELRVQPHLPGTVRSQQPRIAEASRNIPVFWQSSSVTHHQAVGIQANVLRLS